MFNNTTRLQKDNKSNRERLQDTHARGGKPVGGALARVSLSTAHIRPRFEYFEGASLLKTTKGEDCPAVGGGIRARIKGFSRGSRLRMMRTIGAVRRDAELPNFVTLTYPCEFPTVERAKRDLKIFLQRFNRRYTQQGHIWKLEPQERGAPHYHLMVWGCEMQELLLWVVKNWFDIAGNGDPNHWRFHMGLLPNSKPCVQKVRSFRGVLSYASKYLYKTFEVAEWGTKWTGRFWGIGNRENIPFGEFKEIESDRVTVNTWMRYQRRFAGIKPRRWRSNSVTIFCNADQWVGNVARTSSQE